MDRKNLAVFIDFENFGDRGRNSGSRFDAKSLVNLLREKGRLVVKKAYADWGRFPGIHKRQMMENSIELIEMPSHKDKGKNSADIKLVVDALETAITKEHIGTFVVVSGDSDFTPLIAKLREYDKHVIVIGFRRNVSSLLSGYCDELIYYNSLTEGSNKFDSRSETSDPLLRRVIDHLESEGIETRSSIVKQYMKQFDATFNEQHHGFRQFKEYLKNAERRRIIKLRSSEHGEYFVTLNHHKQHSSRAEVTNLYHNDTKVVLYSLIFFSLRLVESLPHTICRISVVAQMTRKLDSDFSLAKYGYSKSQGFKKILQDMETESLLSLRLDPGLNDYLIAKTEKLCELSSGYIEPDNYREVWLQSILNAHSLLILPEIFEYVVTLLTSLLQIEPNGVSLSHFFEQLESNEDIDIFSPASISRVTDLLTACGAVITNPTTTETDIEEESQERIIVSMDTLHDAWAKMLNYAKEEVTEATDLTVSTVEIAQAIGLDHAPSTD